MSRNRLALFIAISIFAAGVFSACTKSPGAAVLPGSKKVKTAFSLILPAGYSYDKTTGALTAPNSTISKNAQSAPSYLTGAQVTVTGEGTPPLVLKVDIANAVASYSVQPGLYNFHVAVFTNIGLSFTGNITAYLQSGDNGTLVITMGVNAPPATIGASVSNATPKVGDTITLSCNATDPDNDPMSYSWTGPGFSAGGPVVSYTIKSTDPLTFICVASDGLGGVLTASVSVAPGLTCMEPNLVCNGACADPLLDNNNCGACGNVCGANMFCGGGKCAPIPGCPAPLTDCGGWCVDVKMDAANCGACGKICGANMLCSGGACVSACAPPTVDCGGVCVDTKLDAANCGACGNACPAPQACLTGVCGVCPIGPPTLTPCGGVCVDLMFNAFNCGACGVACGVGKTCVSGICGCMLPQVNCGGICTDTMMDPNNCLSCGNVCPGGQACTSGICGNCAPPLTNCGTCVDLMVSGAHCGACGNVCPFGFGCVGGTCVCSTPRTLCSPTVCVDLIMDMDINNCGACGNVCAPGQTCSAGACVCPPFTPTLCGGACTDTMMDPNNCGACGNPCQIGFACSGGACVCSAPMTLCSPTVCADLTVDTLNCGACGNACGLGLTCSAGICM